MVPRGSVPSGVGNPRRDRGELAGWSVGHRLGQDGVMASSVLRSLFDSETFCGGKDPGKVSVLPKTCDVLQASYQVVHFPGGDVCSFP